MTPCVVFDLDGTIADCRHRLHLSNDYDKFFVGIPDDAPIGPALTVLQSLHATNERIVLCTARPERTRAMTEAWLANHGVPHVHLYMRADGDNRPSAVVKAQLLNGMIQDGWSPTSVFEDKQSVVDMWREHGIHCFQCADSGPLVSKDTKLTLMVGPSGAGKTSFLFSRKEVPRSSILSSDELRTELCGDFRDQSRDDQVFAALHSIAKSRLKCGLDTVIDATHLRRRDRLAAVDLADGVGQVAYVVVNRPMVDKYRTAGWRASVQKDGKPFDLIQSHEDVFRANLKDILAGDGLPNVKVVDLRGKE